MLNFYESLQVTDENKDLEVQHIDIKHCGHDVLLQEHIKQLQYLMDLYRKKQNKSNKKHLKAIDKLYKHNVILNFCHVVSFINT